jgi:hypothetical protein
LLKKFKRRLWLEKLKLKSKRKNPNLRRENIIDVSDVEDREVIIEILAYAEYV